ncbi:hypothetical protein Hanom_Chr05g00459701 [Helianthus anomalus]
MQIILCKKQPPAYFFQIFFSSRFFIPLASSFHSYFDLLRIYKLCQTRTRIICQPIP